MKLWSKHWLTLKSRSFGPLRRESPLVLLSIEDGSIGERDIPVRAKPILRHYMSNIFLYLMPAEAEEGSVHGWELKLGFALDEAKDFLEELSKTIESCEKRMIERHRGVRRGKGC
ncbi:MAG: hypothetical protein HWN68_16245 [Desulfobacterales bacterium]|nr:hypothetical protein [Desulfobacterales bacterium]